MGMPLSTATFGDGDRAPTGLALLSADVWLDVGPCLDFYDNATLRFTSGALNRLVRHNSSALPVRVIEAVVVQCRDSWAAHKDKSGYSAEALTADLKTYAAAVLNACAARMIPYVALTYAEDVMETEILDFLFSNNSATTVKELVIHRLRQALSEDFFGMVVERCRRNVCCKSLYVGIGHILEDPTDAKYSHNVVERSGSEALYKFEKASEKGPSFTIVVGKGRIRYYLRVFQGDANENCGSLEEVNKRFARQTANSRQCQIL